MLSIAWSGGTGLQELKQANLLRYDFIPSRELQDSFHPRTSF